MSGSVACPHCTAGNVAAWRESTSEWVHRYSPVLPSGGRQFSITLCVAGTPFVSKAPGLLSEAISAREAASVASLKPDEPTQVGLAPPNSPVGDA
jgi:hypothetical protein